MPEKTWLPPRNDDNLISVIIPTKDRATLLEETLQSVAEQTYRPLELIIVDDGSTDETQLLLEAWARTCTTTVGLSLETRRLDGLGAAAARNEGLRHSRGAFIQYLDSDDIILPDKMEHQYTALLQEHSAAYAYSETSQFAGNRSDIWPAYTGFPLANYFPTCLENPPWAVMSGLYRREAVEKIGPWEEDLPIYNDWEYCVRFLALKPKIIHLPGVLSLARIHPLGRLEDAYLTSRGAEGIVAAVQRVEETLKHGGLDHPTNRAYLARHYAKAAWSATRCGSDELAQRAEQGALVPGASAMSRLLTLGARAARTLPVAGRRPLMDMIRRVHLLVTGRTTGTR